MNTNTANHLGGDRLLRIAAASWYFMAVIGLTTFLVYVIINYGGAAISGDDSGNETKLIEGDTIGNFFLISHLSLAVVVIGGGLLQLLPALRNRFPVFHRWNGRLFMVCALACSLAGQYLILTREIPGDWVMDMGTSSAGILVIVFGFLAYRTARAKSFVQHRKWAMRLFLVANAGWFFRIGLMLWFVINQGPVGIDIETFTGPALVFISYAQFLLPLAILQLYFHAQASTKTNVKVAVSVLILIAAIATLAGVVAASFMMWFR